MQAFLSQNDKDLIVVDVTFGEAMELTSDTSLLIRMAEHDAALGVVWDKAIVMDEDNRFVISREQAKIALGLRRGTPADHDLIDAIKELIN